MALVGLTPQAIYPDFDPEQFKLSFSGGVVDIVGMIRMGYAKALQRQNENLAFTASTDGFDTALA